MGKHQIRKSAGHDAAFDEAKLVRSLRGAGASDEAVQRVLHSLRSRLGTGLSTSRLHSMAHEALKRQDRRVAGRYGLRRNLMALGPSGYPFERFWAGVMQSEGWSTEVGVRVQGRFVGHEVDVVSRRGKRLRMAECKFHGRPGTKSDVKVSLYVYARSLDIGDRHGDLDRFSLVTNTRFTSDARRHGEGVGMELVSWEHPEGSGLRARIEAAGLYPVTCLTTLRRKQQGALVERGIVLCHQIVDAPGGLDALKLRAGVAAKVVDEAERLIGLDTPRQEP